MRKPNFKAWAAQIIKRQIQVGKVRDAIREDIADMEDLADNCDEAYENMQRAIDALSELA